MTIKAVSAAGHRPVALVRNPTASADRMFDLEREVDESTVDGLDGLIHIAWSWAVDSQRHADPNLVAGAGLARACESSGIRPVLLSTYSVFAAASSEYGAAKLDLERDFLEAGGTALRAGLIWGGSATGMVATLLGLAKSRHFCIHLTPEPVMHHSEQTALASALAAAATSPESQNEAFLASSQETVALTQILHAAAPSRKRLHMPVPLNLVIAAARMAEKLRVNLPFRLDSLSAVTPEAERAAAEATAPQLLGFPGSDLFLEWLESLNTTA